MIILISIEYWICARKYIKHFKYMTSLNLHNAVSFFKLRVDTSSSFCLQLTEKNSLGTYKKVQRMSVNVGESGP